MLLIIYYFIIFELNITDNCKIENSIYAYTKLIDDMLWFWGLIQIWEKKEFTLKYALNTIKENQYSSFLAFKAAEKIKRVLIFFFDEMLIFKVNLKRILTGI